MNLKSYIESGILELYVLDSLSRDERLTVERVIKNHPVLRDEIAKIERALENYADLNAAKPRQVLKGRILDNIVNLQKEQVMNVNDLPLINAYTNYKNWLSFIEGLGIVPSNNETMKVLRSDDDVLQLLVTTTADIVEESHEDELESLLILSGECRCNIAGNIHFLNEGGFIEIPRNRPHDIKLITPAVTAIVQRIKF